MKYHEIEYHFYAIWVKDELVAVFKDRADAENFDNEHVSQPSEIIPFCFRQI